MTDENNRGALQAKIAWGQHPGLGHKAYELVVGASNLLPFSFLRVGDRVGRAVIKIQRPDGVVATGVLVSPGVLLTSNHVLPNIEVAHASYAVANYETNPPADIVGQAIIAPLSPEVLFLGDVELDFSFCGVEGLDFLGYVPLERGTLSPFLSEYVNIIQHPHGRSKEVALQDNRVVAIDNVYLRYACDTEPGSSGSPVFDDSWRLVALHHASVSTERSEQIPQDRYGVIAKYVNEGVRIPAIATWLEIMSPKTAEEVRDLRRTRALFQGLDTRLGFFGALGRKPMGAMASDMLNALFSKKCMDIDLGFWDLSLLAQCYPGHIANLGRAIGEMQLDVWCLLNVSAVMVRGLTEHLETSFRLEYGSVLEEVTPNLACAVLYRRGEFDAVKIDLAKAALGNGSLLCVELKPRCNRAGGFALRVVLLHEQSFNDCVVEKANQAWTVRADCEYENTLSSQVGYIFAGEVQTFRALNRSSETLPRFQVSMLSWGAQSIGMVLGDSSFVRSVFLSPNLSINSVCLTHSVGIADDRSLPLSVTELGEPYPAAMRLSLGSEVSRSAFGESNREDPVSDAVKRGKVSEFGDTKETESSCVALDGELEQQLRCIFEPMVGRLAAVIRNTKAGNNTFK